MFKVGQVYKSINGSEYTYVGPFTRRDKTLGAAFYSHRENAPMEDWLVQRNADGSTNIDRTREFDIIDPDAIEMSETERQLILKLLKYRQLPITASALEKGVELSPSQITNVKNALILAKEIRNAHA